MTYPVEEMNYKMKFLNDKLENGEKLTLEEEDYMKKMAFFKKNYDAMCLEQQLKNVEIDEDAVLTLLAKKREELVKVIRGTKSKNKLLQLRNQVKNIDEFMQSDAVKYFKEVLLDEISIKHVDIVKVFSDLAYKDRFLSASYLAGDRKSGFYGSAFALENQYLKTMTFNRPLIDLTRRVLMGDFSLYNALKEGKSTFADGTLIPDEFRKIRLEDISAITHYGRGRVDEMEDHTFDTLKDDLDILVAIDQVQKGDITKVDDAPIKDAIRDILMGIISGKYTVKDFTNYQILDYFDKGIDTTKFRELLKRNNFNIDSVQREVFQDDLLRVTNLNQRENLFIDENGELNVANISLASAVMNGEDVDDEESLSADLSCLNRINYYQPAHRNNPHEYERDKYDVKILLAIARYKDELKKEIEQDAVEKKMMN